MYLGMEIANNSITNRVIGYPGDAHMLAIGPTRSGKSRRLLVPNLLYETGRSMLVIDMKGELAAISAAHRQSKGNRVVALDPFGVLAQRGLNIPCVGFNPMAALDPKSDDFVDDAMGLAESLVKVDLGANSHFGEAAQDFLGGIIMLVRCMFGNKATLGMVRREISRPPEEIEIIARQVIKTPPHEAIRNKLSKYAKIGESREIPSIISTAQTQTRFLDSPAMVRNLAATGIDFEALKREPITCYLVLPARRLITHAKWLSLIVSSAMTAMQRSLKVQGRPDVLFMLDEFPQLGRMASVESAVALNAGYGVKVWAAVQHLGQLKDLYDDNWETFVSAGCLTTFAPRDFFTRDHLSKLIGQGTKPMQSRTIASDGSVSVSHSVQKDDLMNPHQWRQMIMGEQFAFIPTDKGQLIKHLFSPDFTQLPEVVSGAIRPGQV